MPRCDARRMYDIVRASTFVALAMYRVMFKSTLTHPELLNCKSDTSWERWMEVKKRQSWVV